MIRRQIVFILTGAVILIAAFSLSSYPGAAAPQAQGIQPQPTLIALADEYCLGCHGTQGQTFPLGDGSQLDLYVNPLDHADSIHGSLGYACVQCHTDIGEYPHPPFEAENLREITLRLNTVCQRCHQTQYDRALDSVHARAQAEGQSAAAVCTDCHTAHAVRDWVDEKTGETLQEARTLIPSTCAQCHSTIYENYLESVHGSALNEENNSDVPTCIDCHGVHNIGDPTTSTFRLVSPQLCAGCHTDVTRMTKYGISTDVLDTYIADFHGTTVTLFEKTSPDAQTNKPVCFDCHGVHNIKRADDPEKGLQVKENMLAACQKCHPDANENFPTSWLSHYIPSPERYPIVFYVDLFYKFFIPTVLGGMAILVVMDGTRKTYDIVKKSRGGRKKPPAPPQVEDDHPVPTIVEPPDQAETGIPDRVDEEHSDQLEEEHPSSVEDSPLPSPDDVQAGEPGENPAGDSEVSHE